MAKSNRAFLPDLARALNNLGVMYSELGRREEALKPTEEAVGIYGELAKSNRAFLPDLATSLGALGAVWRQADDLQAASESFREGLAVLLPAVVAYPQALQPLAVALLREYVATLEPLGLEPDAELLAAYLAALAPGDAPP
ncbi:MAG: tetratricopeptide repeat protein [Cyanobacteriota bacterium]